MSVTSVSSSFLYDLASRQADGEQRRQDSNSPVAAPQSGEAQSAQRSFASVAAGTSTPRAVHRHRHHAAYATTATTSSESYDDANSSKTGTVLNAKA